MTEDTTVPELDPSVTVEELVEVSEDEVLDVDAVEDTEDDDVLDTDFDEYDFDEEDDLEEVVE
jgi:hypothetical protein